MLHRDTQLLEIRPVLEKSRAHERMSPQEFFQNKTLRPIIKLQNDIILALFRNYIYIHKGIFHKLSPKRRVEYIESSIHKDIKFRNTLKGLVIGQFTMDELQIYNTDETAINKRIMSMIKERLKSQIQLLSSH